MPTKLDTAMKKHIIYIILEEKRPFSYLDFLRFEVEGEEYQMDHGTFRNKISILKKSGEVEIEYKTHITFYTLKGHKFTREVITPYHTGGNTYGNNNNNNSSNGNHTRNDYLYKIILNLPLDKNSIHDIRLNFTVKGLWSILSQLCEYDPNFYINTSNHGISIPTWKENNLLTRVTVHKTDKVSVIIGCSLVPINLDVWGICRLVEMLTRIEERLYYIIKDFQKSNRENLQLTNTILIPHHTSWIVTMWHFGADSMTQATGEKFSITVRDGLNILYRVYTKKQYWQTTRRNNSRSDIRIRIEKQEYPASSLQDAINEKLSVNT